MWKLIALTMILLLGLDGYVRLMPKIEGILDNAQATSFHAKLAAIEVRQEIALSRQFTAEQRGFFNSPTVRKRLAEGIVGFGRLGNTAVSLNELLRDFRRTNDSADVLLKSLSSEVAGQASVALERATKSLESVGRATDETRLAIADIRDLVKSPEILQLLTNLALMSASGAGAMESVDLMAKDVREGVPVLRDALIAIARGLQLTAEQVALFATSLNKPLTFGQKVLKFFVEAIAKSFPVILGR